MSATVQTHSHKNYPRNPHVRPATAHTTLAPTHTHTTRYDITEDTHPRLSDINESILLRTLLGIALAFLLCIALWLLLFFGISQGSVETTQANEAQSLSI